MSCGFCYKPHSAADHVRYMREDFLLLVAAYNGGGDFAAAMDAQAVVIALDKFEDGHCDMHQSAWPPEPDPEGGLLWMSQNSEVKP
jgi:hypothetical protein